MIIDQFGVFFDDAAVAASMTSKVVNVMPYAGRDDSMYITLLAKGANTTALNFTVKVQQSADNTTFTDVETFTFNKADALPALKAIRLPVELKEKYVRLTATVSGTVAGTKLFSGITRDHLAPYDEGLYIDKGKVVA